jgi:phage tail-like protein
MRDAQGHAYWQWCAEADFHLPPGDAIWDDGRHALTLRSLLGIPPEGVPPAMTRTAASRPAIALDAYGGWARVELRGGRDRLLAGGAVDPETEIYAAPAGSRIRDVAATTRDWLIVAHDDGTVLVRDLQGRIAEAALAEPGFAPDRIVEAGDGRIWLLDRAGRALRRLAGDPVPDRVMARPRPAHLFQPRPLDLDPLRMEAPRLATLGIGEEIIDATGLPDGRLALLCLGPGRTSTLRLTDGIGISDAIAPEGLRSAFSLGLYRDDRLALAVPNAAAAVVVPLDAGDAPPLLGISPPLRRGTGGRFCKSPPGLALHYPSAPVPQRDGGPDRPFARLVAPSRPSYARQGAATAVIVEADRDGSLWHRLYLEAHLPAGSGILLNVAAGDDRASLEALPSAELHPHRFGAVPAGDGPRGIWLDQDSELGFRRSAVGQPRRRDRCGLFSVLLQRRGAAPRRIVGRYLRMDLELSGPGVAAPQVCALRIWGAAEPWRDRYLPAYLSVEAGPLAEGSDFLDRYLSIFEGLLTPIEDQVAASYRLTRPDTAPEDALDWLASWIGAELDPALSPGAKRRLLARSVALWRRRGTLTGLERMLDIVTDGGIQRGDLVVLEHFHLRRTFSTILGTDLSNTGNPLVPHARASGNSHLGSTFFLGAENTRAFLALFRPSLLDDPLTDPAERAAAVEELEALFSDHAFRVTVLVHAEMAQAARDLVSRVLEREVPAHVQARLVDGPGSLVLALSSLVGVETRFGRVPARKGLTLDAAEIGQVFLGDTPSLDPRIEGGA